MAVFVKETTTVANILATIDKPIAECETQVRAYLESRKDDLYGMLEWSDKTVEKACQQRVLLRLKGRLEYLLKDKGEDLELSFKDLQAHVADEFKHARAYGRSSSAMSNIMEACLVDTSRSFCEAGGYFGGLTGFFYEALRMDPVYVQQSERRYEENRQKAAAQQALEEKAKRDAAAARRKARRGANK